MKTKHDFLFSVILACAAAVGLGAPARAQSDSGTTPAKQRKPAAKTHKVWTEDDLATVRKLADNDADKKIAWEERDIQGQEETIARLQEELGQASPDRKEHLQQLIEQHKQILQDVRKELAGLQAQRKQLEK